jgi:hypothetical protein
MLERIAATDCVHAAMRIQVRANSCASTRGSAPVDTHVNSRLGSAGM